MSVTLPKKIQPSSKFKTLTGKGGVVLEDWGCDGFLERLVYLDVTLCLGEGIR